MSQAGFNTSWFRLDIRSQQLSMRAKSIYPTLEFSIRFSITQTNTSLEVSNKTIHISHVRGEVFIEDYSLGFVEGRETSHSMRLPNSEYTTQLFLQLDHYGLNQIEKYRHGNDLNLKLRVMFNLTDPNEDEVYYEQDLTIYVAKSDWVEKLLASIKFKEVFMLEVPTIDNLNFSEIINHLHEAWKQQSMGEPNKVVTECRKALEGLRTKIMDADFKTNSQEGQKPIPDWKKFFGNENVGDIFGTINKKFTGFLAPGAHYGKELSLSDSYFAIMMTHAILQYAIKRFEQIT